MCLGIAIMQPALPPLVRMWAPTRIGFATALYTNGLLIGEVIPAWFKARSHGEAGLVLVGRMMASSRFQRWCKYGSRYWRSSEATRE